MIVARRTDVILGCVLDRYVTLFMTSHWRFIFSVRSSLKIIISTRHFLRLSSFIAHARVIPDKRSYFSSVPITKELITGAQFTHFITLPRNYLVMAVTNLL